MAHIGIVLGIRFFNLPKHEKVVLNYLQGQGLGFRNFQCLRTALAPSKNKRENPIS